MNFKPIKAPKRTPKPPPGLRERSPIALSASTKAALGIVRRLLRDMRWDDQGGYVGRHQGRWDFVSTMLGQVTPDEPDEVVVITVTKALRHDAKTIADNVKIQRLENAIRWIRQNVPDTRTTGDDALRDACNRALAGKPVP